MIDINEKYYYLCVSYSNDRRLQVEL